MRLGGLDHLDRPRVFLLSTTHGAETHALAAAIATMRVYQNEPVIEHLTRQGERLREQAEAVIRHHRLEDYVSIIGRASCLLYGTRDLDGKPSQAMRTLLLQETIRRGVLMPSLVVSYSHTDEDIERTIEALDGGARRLSPGARRRRRAVPHRASVGARHAQLQHHGAGSNVCAMRADAALSEKAYAHGNSSTSNGAVLGCARVGNLRPTILIVTRWPSPRGNEPKHERASGRIDQARNASIAAAAPAGCAASYQARVRRSRHVAAVRELSARRPARSA